MARLDGEVMRSLMLLIAFPMSLLLGGSAFAHPTMGMPGVSLGSNPYRVFGGEVAGGATTTLLTVPEGQEFIITMVRASESGVPMMEDGEPDETGMQLLSDGEVVLTGHAIGTNSRVSIAQGDGKLPVAAGAALALRSINPLSPATSYYIQGYLIEAGSPFRSVMGQTPSASHDVQTVFTADSDRDFLVRTLAVKPVAGSCDVYLDGALLIGNNTATYLFGDDVPLWVGNGMVVVPAGSSLQLRTYGYRASYYIDGEYITP